MIHDTYFVLSPFAIQVAGLVGVLLLLGVIRYLSS